MKTVTKKCKSSYNETIWTEAEKQFSISIRNDIKQFLKANNGGFPTNDIIVVNEEEYEVRVFLSLDKNDENYCIVRPLNYFLTKTKARIIPFALDSGDNYYCVNNENGKVYYWKASSDNYFALCNSLETFLDLF